MNFLPRFYFLLIAILLQACASHYRSNGPAVSQMRMKSDSLGLADAKVVAMILPYKLKLDSQMNEVIATSDVDLIRSQPESTLGNFVADAIVAYGNGNHTLPVDLCVINYGGLRIPLIEKGDITLGRIYELMPFDNQIELLEVDGSIVKRLLDHAAAYGGWPVGLVRMKINNMVAEEIMVNGQPLDLNRKYLLITSDYLANGGDGASMLKTAVKKNQFNYKFRDALIDHLRNMKKHNQHVTTQQDGRVSIVQPEKIH